MIIANPIYDVAFKYLMEDLDIAKGVISRIIQQNVEALQFSAQEGTVPTDPSSSPGVSPVLNPRGWKLRANHPQSRRLNAKPSGQHTTKFAIYFKPCPRASNHRERCRAHADDGRSGRFSR